MADPSNISVIRTGLHPSVAPWAPEVKYVLRTLLRIAGYAAEFVWSSQAPQAGALDIFYGPAGTAAAASVEITACGLGFDQAPRLEPLRLREQEGQAFMDFGAGGGIEHLPDKRLRLTNDIVFGAYWLLTGAREPFYRRDRMDNIDLKGSMYLSHRLNERPLVSEYATLLRQHFASQAREPQAWPWKNRGAAFAFTHDVDYPQILRWVECLRLVGTRGRSGLPLAASVMRGTSHFWKFSEWIDFEGELDARPAFYFMARKGSLLKYAMGTPDAFYDINAPEFRQLFAELRERGCEVGLHASFNAHRSAEQIRREKETLERVSGMPVEGNRHHYWHLDPAAPHHTLRKQEEAGLRYDSSLGFEYYPGFRRGVCHPFRIYHPEERRELKLVELPPTWMDDHFDRRLAKNGISDPTGYAKKLVGAARATEGVVVVDYHVRGMNADFYPRYGPWLQGFIRDHMDSAVSYATAGEIVRQYEAREKTLDEASVDRALPAEAAGTISVRSGPSAPAPVASREKTQNAAASITAPVADSQPAVSMLRDDEAAAWDAFVAAHPAGNIYHTLSWRAVTQEAFGHQPYYLRALDRSAAICGVLPLFLVQGVFGRRLVSVPMRDRGGLLAGDPASGAALLRSAVSLTRELGCKYLELRSLEPIDPGLAGEYNLRIENNWVTTRVDLSPGATKLWKALDRDAVRWAINKAKKRGIRVAEDASERGMEIFYKMFSRTRTSMGIPPFPRNLFSAIWKHMIAPGRGSLLLVYDGDRPISGLVSFFSKDSFIPAYAAPQREWRKLYPSESAFWHAIEWASRNGFRWLDFGADSIRQEGLLFFKKKWGGVQQPMCYAYFLNGIKSPPDLDSSSPVYSFARTAWKAFPLPVSERLGSWVTRQLS